MSYPQKHKKSYYVNSGNKRPKGKILQAGCKGFMLTCNFQEPRAITEGFCLLNDCADKLYPSDSKEIDTEKAKDECSKEVEDDLEEELESLRSKVSNHPRFSQCFTGVKNILFIQSEVGDPCKMALSILETIKETKILNARYLLRLIPVLSTCRPFLDNLKKAASEALDEFLIRYDEYGEGQMASYAVQFATRNNNKCMKKEDVFDLLNELVRTKNVQWKISLKEPDLVLNVDVLGTACCFGVLPRYAALKKYNVVELARQDDAANDKIKSKESTVEEKKEVDTLEVKEHDETQSPDTLKDKNDTSTETTNQITPVTKTADTPTDTTPNFAVETTDILKQTTDIPTEPLQKVTVTDVEPESTSELS